MKTTTVGLPASWANVLVNNDWSGLSLDDKGELITWLAANPRLQLNCLMCSDEAYLERFNWLLRDILDYTFTVYNPFSITKPSADRVIINLGSYTCEVIDYDAPPYKYVTMSFKMSNMYGLNVENRAFKLKSSAIRYAKQQLTKLNEANQASNKL